MSDTNKNNPYSIRAKDFCNCYHAQALYQAILDANVIFESKGIPNKKAHAILTKAIAAHAEAKAEDRDLGERSLPLKRFIGASYYGFGKAATINENSKPKEI